ncbi:MAG: hypothetical protein PHD32_12045 [Eubacteriales bacterium]|nr:hypothetical protein [Eubacteriales bacterium]
MFQPGDTVPLRLPDGRQKRFILQLAFLYHGERYGVLAPRRKLFSGSALIARAQHPCLENECFLPLPPDEQETLLEYLQR